MGVMTLCRLRDNAHGREEGNTQAHVKLCGCLAIPVFGENGSPQGVDYAAPQF